MQFRYTPFVVFAALSNKLIALHINNLCGQYMYLQSVVSLLVSIHYLLGNLNKRQGFPVIRRIQERKGEIRGECKSWGT